MAREKNVVIKNYNIIYHLVDDIKIEMQKLIEVEIKRIDLGKMKVLAIFRTENKQQIIGGKIIEGKAESKSFIEVLRNKEIVAAGKMIKLQSGKQDVNSVEIGGECGIQYEGPPIIQIEDELQFYKEEKTIKNI